MMLETREALLGERCRACRGGEPFAIRISIDCIPLCISILHQSSLIRMLTNCCPLSVALAGASSPQGEPLLSLTSIHLVYTQKTYLILIPMQSAKATATSPSGEVAANHSKNLNPNTLNKHPIRCVRRRQHAHC